MTRQLVPYKSPSVQKIKHFEKQSFAQKITVKLELIICYLKQVCLQQSLKPVNTWCILHVLWESVPENSCRVPERPLSKLFAYFGQHKEILAGRSFYEFSESDLLNKKLGLFVESQQKIYEVGSTAFVCKQQR